MGFNLLLGVILRDSRRDCDVEAHESLDLDFSYLLILVLGSCAGEVKRCNKSTVEG